MNSSSVPTWGAQTMLGKAGELAFEDLTWGGRHLGAGGCQEVAVDHRAARLPGQEAQGLQVGLHHHVAVAGLPGRDFVAVDGVHVDVDGEQVAAAFGAVVHDVFEEELHSEPLALQATHVIGDGNDHGVDRALGGESAEFVDGERIGLDRPSGGPLL
jgi:hypothetical protein